MRPRLTLRGDNPPEPPPPAVFSLATPTRATTQHEGDEIAASATTIHDRHAGAAGHAPATPAGSWSEIVDLSHEGFAVLDAHGRFEFATARAASTLDAVPDELSGRWLGDVLPGLTPGDIDAICAAPVADGPVRLVCTHRGADGWIRALRLTFVPRARDRHERVGAIMLSHDITALRVVQDQRRRAQHRLTRVEDEEQQRIRREVHDGPVQILAALALWVGVSAGRRSGPDELTALEDAIERAATELREILDDPRPAHAGAARWLQHWSAPMIDGTHLSLQIDDRTAEPPNRATTEALFVFVHETIKAATVSGRPRRIDATLAEEAGGYRLTLTVPEGAAFHIDTDPTSTNSLHRYATLLGGSVRSAGDEHSGVRITAVLPSLDERGWSPDSRRLRAARCEPRPDDAPGGHPQPELTDADRAAVASASFHGVMELDADLRVLSVNESAARMTQQPTPTVVGRRLDELFGPDDYACLLPHIERARTGRPVRFEWRRQSAGKPRWAQVAVSPRVGTTGHVEGALVTTLDTTDLHLAEELRDAVLADLAAARRAARRRTARRLHGGPIERLDAVNDRLVGMIGAGHRVGRGLPAIQRELERSILALRTMADRIDDPDPPAEPWGQTGPAVPT